MNIRILFLSVAMLSAFLAGCMHTGTPMSSVNGYWLEANCKVTTSLYSQSGKLCASHDNASEATNVAGYRLGLCFYQDYKGEFLGILSRNSEGNPMLWCGIAELNDHPDNKEYRNQSVLIRSGGWSTQQTGVDWGSTGLLIAGIAAAAIVADEMIDDDSSSGGYNTSGTGDMSSSELGEELLRQKNIKGIRGRGQTPEPPAVYSVTNDPGKPIPPARPPPAVAANSIGYEKAATKSAYSPNSPAIGYEASSRDMRLDQENRDFCRYSGGGSSFAIQKLRTISCPASVRVPSRVSDSIFDYGKFFSREGLTGTKVNQTSINCTYKLPAGRRTIVIPKGTGAYCPDSYDF